MTIRVFRLPNPTQPSLRHSASLLLHLGQVAHRRYASLYRLRSRLKSYLRIHVNRDRYYQKEPNLCIYRLGVKG